MDVCSDFVSPIEKHWIEAAALRDSRTRGFHHSNSYAALEPGGSPFLYHRPRIHASERVGTRTSSRPSSVYEHVKSRRRSQTASSSERSGGSGESTLRSTPVCVAPPDILPIYEQKQLFAAAVTKSRITSASPSYYVNPSLFHTANLSRSTHSQHERQLTPTPSRQGRKLSIGTSSNNNLQSSGPVYESITAGTSASSISSILSTAAEKSPSISRRNSDKPIQRIDCKPNPDYAPVEIKGARPIIRREAPVIRRRTEPEATNLHKFSLRSHLSANIKPKSASREHIDVSTAGYNFSSVLPKPYPVIFDSDTASTISDEFYVPIRKKIQLFAQQQQSGSCRRIVRNDDVLFGSISNECSLEFRMPKFYSKEVADWSVAASYRQNRRCIETCKRVHVRGYNLSFATEDTCPEVVFEDLESVIVPPRRFQAKVSYTSSAHEDGKLDFESWVILKEVTIRDPVRILETNLDFEAEEDEWIEEDQEENLCMDDFPEENVESCSKKSSTSTSASDTKNESDESTLNYNEEFNCVLVMQLFNLIGRLTDELKRLESDCVEIRAELAEVKQNQGNVTSATQSKTTTDTQLCHQCSQNINPAIASKSILKPQAKQRITELDQEIPKIPVDLQREIDIPIALARPRMKEKRKKTIREKVFGLGRVTRSRQYIWQSLQRSNSGNKVRFSFDGESCDDFSIGRPSEPIYDVPPFELEDDPKRVKSVNKPRVEFKNVVTKIEECLKESENDVKLEDGGFSSTPQTKRLQAIVRENWAESCKKYGRYESKRSHAQVMIAGSEERRNDNIERALNVENFEDETDVAIESRETKFNDWVKRTERYSEALILDDDDEIEETIQAKLNTSLETSQEPKIPVPPPRRVIRPPDDLFLASQSGIKEVYDNWMEFKSTKAPRLSPDTGGDLKVRFDVHVREKTYFKDETPKMSSMKGITSSGFRLKSRMQTRLRTCASSLADRVRRSSRGAKRISEPGEYEDLDLLDERVSQLAEQSNQLCRNLTIEAQSGLRLPPPNFNDSLLQNDYPDMNESGEEDTSRPSSSDYIDLSTLDTTDEKEEQTKSRNVSRPCTCPCGGSPVLSNKRHSAEIAVSEIDVGGEPIVVVDVTDSPDRKRVCKQV